MTPSFTQALSASVIKASARSVLMSMGFRREHAGLSAGDSLLRAKTGRTADDDHIHRPMREKRVEVLIRPSAVLPPETLITLAIRSVDGDHAGPRRPRRPRVRVADLASANQTDGRFHGMSIIASTATGRKLMIISRRTFLSGLGG